MGSIDAGESRRIDMKAYDHIIDRLTKEGVSFQIHEHGAVRTIEDAERLAPELVENLLKTVVFKIKDSFWVLAAVRCRERIDYSKLSAALGVNRRQLRSMSPEAIQEELGYEVGGIGPIPVRSDAIAIFDSSLAGAGMIYCGSGKNTRTLGLEFSDLLRASEGSIHPIVSKPKGDGERAPEGGNRHRAKGAAA